MSHLNKLLEQASEGPTTKVDEFVWNSTKNKESLSTKHANDTKEIDPPCEEALNMTLKKPIPSTDTSDELKRAISPSSAGSLSLLMPDITIHEDTGTTLAATACKFSNEECTTKERRRRQKLVSKVNLICQVCGDKANGYNFGAITCESCKAFFRRNALKNKDIKCNFEQNCKIDHFTRKFCTACRLQKCFDSNMKKEWILDEDALKKRKKLTRRAKEDAAACDMRHAAGGANTMPDSTCQIAERLVVSGEGSSSSEDPNFPPMPLSEEDQAEIEKIMAHHTDMIDLSKNKSGELATEVQQANASTKDNDRNYSTDAQEFSSLTDQPSNPSELFNMADGFVRRLIKFVKELPEYRTLDQQDQIALLKGCIMETMVLRSAIMFDPNINGFQVEDKTSKQRKDLKITFIQQALGDDIYVEHMKFITGFNTVARWDKPTMVLAMIINLFSSDRCNLRDKQKVASAEERYSLLLQAYLRSKYSFYEARSIYPKLLLKLTDVRSYGNMSSQMVQNLSPTELAPLLSEVFSM